MGKYLFFIDMEGHRLDSNISKTLTIIKKKVKMFKLLGSYKTVEGALKQFEVTLDIILKRN